LEKDEFSGMVDLIENTCSSAAMFFMRKLKIACDELNLLLMHGQVLLFLLNSKKHISQTEICKYMETNASVLSRLIDSIEEVGLVQRFTPQENRRAKFIELTDTGQVLAAKLYEKMGDTYFQILKPLNKKESEMLKVIFEKIKRNLQNEE
jgi:DNA-binding MarR family transcriptional regulator